MAMAASPAALGASSGVVAAARETRRVINERGEKSRSVPVAKMGSEGWARQAGDASGRGFSARRGSDFCICHRKCMKSTGGVLGAAGSKWNVDRSDHGDKSRTGAKKNSATVICNSLSPPPLPLVEEISDITDTASRTATNTCKPAGSGIVNSEPREVAAATAAHGGRRSVILASSFGVFTALLLGQQVPQSHDEQNEGWEKAWRQTHLPSASAATTSSSMTAATTTATTSSTSSSSSPSSRAGKELLYDEQKLLSQNRRMQDVNGAPADFPGFIREGFKVQVITNDDYVTTNEGLIFKDYEAGQVNQPPPMDGQQVVFHYTAYNELGKRVDTSYRQGKPTEVRMGNNVMIPGFELGLKTMHVGGRRRLVVPPELGPPVGPGTFFSAKQFEVFDVELLAVNDCKRQQIGFVSTVVSEEVVKSGTAAETTVVVGTAAEATSVAGTAAEATSVVETAGVKPGVETAAIETAAVETTTVAAVETAAVETTAVEAAAVGTATVGTPLAANEQAVTGRAAEAISVAETVGVKLGVETTAVETAAVETTAVEAAAVGTATVGIALAADEQAVTGRARCGDKKESG
ncbi:hypothetical protein CBR_g48120 [Chara braunii]|uniref:peptidylprolyl isomerase n=1 Tax=Chara braunii TaxID=69332 RepID=A0A388M1Y7_CHABU|nr:hypothetical protein CBR_g48120 [Chara braunii]|eukprot:GBG88590.1 hypothetical protein CBR_g48120 [Chara braunii]